MFAIADLAQPLEAPPTVVSHQIPRSTVTRCTLAGGQGYEYFVYVPEDAVDGAPILVTVHGISRNARAHARAFSRFADRYGVVIIAPLFTERQFPGYQRLGVSTHGNGPRADVVLNDMLAEVGAATGARTDRFYLFGYSGGGQFAHRYAMVHPRRVLALAMGAPGWYTFPDEQTRFPRGLAMPASAGLPRPMPQDFLRVPAAVFVGEHDKHRQPALKQTRRVDDQQGFTRIERGQRWIATMRSAARHHQYDTRFEFRVLDGCGHSFRQCMRRGGMGSRVFEFLFGGRAGRQPIIRGEIHHPFHGAFLVFNAA